MGTTLSGPSGGIGGQPFDDEPPESSSNIREIRVWAGSYIDAIQLVLDIDGEPVEYPKRGGANGNLSVMKLDDTEYVNEIYGRFGSYIESLSIRTDRGQIRRFGGQGGSAEFLYVAPQSFKIIGFWGRCGRVLDSIGVHFAKIDT